MSRLWTTIRVAARRTCAAGSATTSARRTDSRAQRSRRRWASRTDGKDYQLARALDLLRGISLYEGRATAGSKG